MNNEFTRLIRFHIMLLVLTCGSSMLLFGGTARVLTQKVSCADPYQIFDYVTNTGTTTSNNYIVRADILETTGEELGTDLGTTPTNLRIYKAGNGTTTPYYAAITIQLGNFATQWVSGNTLRFQVNYIPTGEVSAEWDVVIPAGTATVLIQEPVMVVPPFPAPALSAPQVQISIVGSNCQLSWNPVVGASTYMIYSSSEAYGTYGLISTTAESGYSLSALAPRMFFKVESSHNGYVSEPSEVVGYVKYDCAFGDNFVALPMVQGFTTTTDCGVLYGMGINTINIWNPEFQQWEASVNYGNGYWDPELPVGPGSVLFLNASSPIVFYSQGSLPAAQAQYNLEVGYNTVMIPLNRSDLLSTPLVGASVGDGDTVSLICLWNAEFQQWEASINFGWDFWDPEIETAIGVPVLLDSGTEETWPAGPRKATLQLDKTTK